MLRPLVSDRKYLQVTQGIPPHPIAASARQSQRRRKLDGCPTFATAYSGFPVGLAGVGELHAAFLNESRTRRCWWRPVQEIRIRGPKTVGVAHRTFSLYRLAWAEADLLYGFSTSSWSLNFRESRGLRCRHLQFVDPVPVFPNQGTKKFWGRIRLQHGERLTSHALACKSSRARIASL
jgi:hypothetical protein